MSDVRRILERGVVGFEPRVDALGGTLRRVRRRWWSRRLGAAGAALAVTGGLVVGLWVAFRPAPPPLGPPGGSQEIGRIGGQRPVAIGYGSIWAITCDRRCGNDGRNASGHLVRLDQRTEEVEASIPIWQGQAVAAGEGGVWVVDFWHGTVTRVDPATNRVVAQIHLRLPSNVCESCPGARDFLPFDLTTGAGNVWVITDRGAVGWIEPQSNRVVRYVRIPRENGGGIAVTANRVWITNLVSGVWAIDPPTSTVVWKVPVMDGDHPVEVESLVSAGGALWTAGADTRKTGDPANPYALARGGAVARVDPAAAVITKTFHFGRSVSIAATDDRSVWVVVAGGKHYYRIDTGTNETSGPFSFGGRLAAVEDGWGWVVTTDGELERVRLP